MRGIVTVLNTPFGLSNDIDHEALRRHVDYALAAGVAGFLVPAMAAEVEALSDAERDAILTTVTQTVAGKVPVIGGASAPTPEERLADARRIGQLGCDIVLASLSTHDANDLADEIGRLADASGLPVMVQDWDATSVGLPVSAIVGAFQREEAFRYLKVETANAGAKYSQLKTETSGALHVSGGWAVQQLIEALDRGVDAFMPTAMHFAYVRIIDLYRSGDRAAAVDLFRRLLPVLAFSNQNLELSIRFFKRLLWRQTLYPTPDIRVGRIDPDEFQMRIMDELIELAMTLETELGWRPVNT